LPETIAIIGAGPLGRWLALRAARGGFRVLLEDVMPSNLHHAHEWLRQALSPGWLLEQLTPGVPGLQEPEAKVLGSSHDLSVSFVSTIEDAVREADLAIDCVPDELESKLEIFCLLDRMAPPRSVLATPTTRLSIADLASCTYRPDRCVAIVAEASSLCEGATEEIHMQTTSKTNPEAILLLERFWSRLGFLPRFALDPAEAANSHR
jgi:3-hydroxybutyryl-CoA dehydrogenase